MAAAVVRLSPVSMTMRMPSARSASRAACVEALIGSAMAMTPAGLAVDADEDRRGAVGAQLLGLGRERARVDALLACRNAGVAERDALALDACRARPCRSASRNRSPRLSAMLALLRGRDDGRRQRMLARPLDAGGEAQDARLVEAGRRRRRPSPPGLPSVSVPVLSTTSVSTFSSRSSASAFLISTPASAPRPTPTMIDIGVARPSAHGQAMMSTATAATSA